MTHVKALQAGHSSQGTFEPITPASWKTLLSSASYVDIGVQIEYKYNIDKLLQTKNKIFKCVYQNMINNITEKPHKCV